MAFECDAALRRLVSVGLLYKKGAYAKRRFYLGTAFTTEFLMWLEEDWRYLPHAMAWKEAGLATNAEPYPERMPWRPVRNPADRD